MTNAELIMALRNCINGSCAKCSYHTRFAWCKGKLIEQAADALEAAEQRIDELVTKCRQLEAQMPKEGEWINEQRDRWIYAKCNLCGKVQDVRSNYCPSCGARMRGEHE